MTKPLVTVIMPILNEEAFIERSLGAVLQQDYPQDKLEILVADGMSDDRTLEIIERIAEPGRVRVIDNPRRIQAAGMNEAIREASGEIIVRVDGHTIIEPDYVRQCVETLAATGAANVGGAMDPVGTTLIGRAIAAAGKSPFAVPSAFHVSSKAQYTDTVYLGAWPRKILERVGEYNTEAGVNEDFELNYRIRQAGGKIYFTPLIRSHYYGRQTLRALWRQYFRYGVSKVATLREHPQSLRLRHVIAPGFVAALLLGGGVSFLHPILRMLYLAMLAAYLTANLVASIIASVRHGFDLLVLIPGVFVIIHVAWGTGFWAGVLIPK